MSTQTVTEWLASNKPDDDFIWHRGVEEQCTFLLHTADALQARVRVVGSHKSKSVTLPVGQFLLPGGEHTAIVHVRNNFYDWKAVVDSTAPISIPYELCGYRLVTEEQLAKMKTTALRGEENGEVEESVWFAKYTGGKLLREDGNIWRIPGLACHDVYYEGINRVPGIPEQCFTPYTKGAKQFGAQPPDLVGFLRAIRDCVA